MIHYNYFPHVINEEPIMTKKEDDRRYHFDVAKTEKDVSLIQLPYGYVSDGILSKKLPWSPQQSIFIVSDPGTGKNTFIERILLKDVIEHNARILLFTNRVALSRQVKQRIAHLQKLEGKLALLSDIGLDTQIDFGRVTIVSYQQLETWLKYNNHSRLNQLVNGNYKYVICDEVHYFVSDAVFNGVTNVSMDFIMWNFKQSLKLYMTGTPEEIFPIMKKRECQILTAHTNGYQPLRKKWLIYEFAHDYSWLDMQVFRNQDDMFDIIKESNEKWLVFIEDKSTGEALVDILEGDASMITADSKYPQNDGYETYKTIVEKETFSSRVLVTTAVLENGVNLRGEELKNVVICSHDRTQILQMLGRIRRVPEQRVCMYIPLVELETARKKCNLLQGRCEAFELYMQDIPTFGNAVIKNRNPHFNVSSSLDFTSDGRLIVNLLAYQKEKYFDLPKWQHWLQTIESGDEYFPIVEIFSWVNKKFSVDSMILEKRKEMAIGNFHVFLQTQVGKEMGKDDQASFRKTFTELYNQAYGRRKENAKKGAGTYGANIIKSELEKLNLPYQLLTTDSTNNGTWKLIANGDNSV